MYKNERRELNGTPLGRHSMNQRVMKKSRERQIVFYRTARPIPPEPANEAVYTAPAALIDASSFARLIRSGIYGNDSWAPLGAAVHLVGSELIQYKAMRRR